MKIAKVMLAFGTLALAVASAASSYTVTISEPTWVNGSQLKPGDYQMKINGDKITLKSGKTVIEAAAKVEDTNKKFESTALRVESTDGQLKLQAIELGGTHTQIVLSPGATAAGQ